MKKAFLSIALISGLFYFTTYLTAQTLDEQLHYAAEDGKLDQIEALLKRGANIEAKIMNRPESAYSYSPTKRTPLMAAAMKGRADAVVFLLKKRANIEAVDDFRNTALIAAVGEGRVDVVKLLLKRGAKVNADGLNGTALHWAADDGRNEIVQLLLEKGADIEAGSVDGTPLMVAARRGHLDTVELLLSKGAKMEEYDARGTALDVAAANGKTDVVLLFLSRHANIEAANRSGQTALMQAICTGNAETAQVLLAKGADVNARSRERDTPLMLAATFLRPDIVGILLDKGADLEARTIGEDTPLLAGTCSGRNEAGKLATVQLLLDRGANIDARNKEGLTPLDCANKTKSAAVADLLQKRIQEGRRLEQADSRPPAERFAIYMEAFKRNPQDESLRERILQSATALQERPAVPDEARQLFVQASDQIKQAATPDALVRPIASLRKAVAIAPWWSNAYYNLSRALELSGQYDDAIRQLNFYLKLNPSAADAAEARAHLIGIQAMKAGSIN